MNSPYPNPTTTKSVEQSQDIVPATNHSTKESSTGGRYRYSRRDNRSNAEFSTVQKDFVGTSPDFAAKSDITSELLCILQKVTHIYHERIHRW